MASRTLFRLQRATLLARALSTFQLLVSKKKPKQTRLCPCLPVLTMPPLRILLCLLASSGRTGCNHPHQCPAHERRGVVLASSAWISADFSAIDDAIFKRSGYNLLCPTVVAGTGTKYSTGAIVDHCQEHQGDVLVRSVHCICHLIFATKCSALDASRRAYYTSRRFRQCG